MFTFEETNLICIYNTGSRTDLIAELTAMQAHLEPDEAALAALTSSSLTKLRAMSDEAPCKPTHRWPTRRQSRSPAATKVGQIF